MKDHDPPFSILHSPFSNLSLYLHIPFCKRLCPYCHFYRVPEVPGWEDYLSAVAREMDALEVPEGAKIDTFYTGGGTPTLMPPEFYSALLKTMGERLDLSGLAEATIETDGMTTAEELEGFADAGFDRISIGVKSFDIRVRGLLGAGDLPEPDPVAAARRAGFSSAGLDLVYGIEGQSLEDFRSDLERTVDLGPDHVSLYMLEGPDNGEPEESDADLAAAMFRESSRELQVSGYRQYEITNFALPGEESLHNTVYWEDGDFLGLGPSAHSSVTVGRERVRWRNRPDIGAYMQHPVNCREELSREGGAERAREALILGLRLTKGVHRPSFTRRYGWDPAELLGQHLRELTDLGLVRLSSSRLRLTGRGMLLSNEVFVRVLMGG